MRRPLLLVAALAGTVLGSACTDLPSVQPLCDQLEPMVLMAQSTPDAPEVACLDRIPFGFRATTFDVGSDEATWHLSHEVVGLDVVRVRLDDACRSFAPDRDLSEVDGETGEWTQYVVEQGDTYKADWVRRRGGGCIVVTLDIPDPEWQNVVEEFQPWLRVVARADVAARLLEESDGQLRLNEHEDAGEE